MLRSTDCPPPQTLENWANGSLEEAQAEIVEDHLDGCETCDRYASKIDLLDKSDLLKSHPNYVGEEECVDVLDLIVAGGKEEPSPNRASAIAGHVTLTDTTIRDYKLIRQIGKGGMGTVYLASHVKLHKEVAIKVLRNQVSQQDPSALARFQREMRAVGQLDHPNIVRALDAGDDGGLYFLTMELIEGIDVSDLSKGKRCLAIEDACEITRQAATGLQYAHEQGLVHRDIKPSNMMLEAKPNTPVCVKILDLGLALLPETGSVDIPLTAESQLVGTLEYMAPEQAEGSENLDHRIDIYSLGVTLYRLLTGSIPFRGRELRNPLKRLKALTLTDAPSVASRRPDLPKPLVDLVDQMLARNPADRPETMLEVTSRLSPFCPTLPMLNIPEGLVDTPLDTIDFSNARNLNEADTSPAACETVISPAGMANFSDSNGVSHRKPMAVALIAVASLFCAGIMWLKTDGAYVRVEAESDVDLTVEVIASDTNSKVESFRIGQGSDSFWLETGKYRIQLSSDDSDTITLDHDQLTVHRGGKPVVRVSRVTPKQRDAEINQIVVSEVVETKPPANLPNWKWTTPTSLGTSINSEWKDDQPTLSADGLTMFFSSYCIPRFSGEGDRDLWKTTRSNLDAEWSAVVNLGPEVNSFMKEINPTFHQPTRTLIFSSNRIGGVGNFDLWFSVLSDDGSSWSKPINLGSNANSGYNDDQAEISADGLTLYFASNRPATTSGNNIWYCTRKTVADRWGLPLELSALNSDRNEFAPALSSDLLTLVFCSERDGGFGDKDLWATTRESVTQPWQTPFNLGDQINTASVEAHPAFGSNDQTLIFSTDREPGQGGADLWTTARGLLKKVTIPTATPIGDAPPSANFPFDAEQAKQHQQVWSDHLQLPISYTNSIGMTLQLVPPGEFRMGAGEEEFQKAQATKNDPRPSPMNVEVEVQSLDSEWPARFVKLTKAFYIGRCEVREQDYDFVVGIKPPMKSLGADFPVGMVSWLGAAKFCNALCEIESMPVRYQIDGKQVSILDQEFGYRLPTEAEWEFSCRAGSEAAYPFGEDEQKIDEFAWYNITGTNGDINSPAQLVGQKQPNAFGLFDMLGNHWEWCDDAYSKNRDLPEPWVDPMFHEQSPHRVAKGGFILSIPGDLRSARRRRHLKGMVYRHGGFRIVLVPRQKSDAPDQ